jgi:hypothetical protein
LEAPATEALTLWLNLLNGLAGGTFLKKVLFGEVELACLIGASMELTDGGEMEKKAEEN